MGRARARARGMHRCGELIPDPGQLLDVAGQAQPQLLREVPYPEQEIVDPCHFGDLPNVRDALGRLDKGYDQSVLVGSGAVRGPGVM